MKALHIMFAVALLSAPAAAQTQSRALTLEQAVQTALQRQPSLQQTRAGIEGALARVDQAKAARNPTVSLSASVSAGSLPSGFFDASTSTGLGAQASWRIYDFGQTSANIRAAELSARASSSSLVTAELDIRKQVESAYLEAIARQRLVAASQATVTSEEAHLEQARKFVAAQAKDPIEVAQAQARLANARSSLAQAQSSAATALANLRAAIGWVDPNLSPVPVDSWPTSPANEPEQLATLVEKARKSRPEIGQLDLEIQAAEANVTAASYGNRPVLSATASTQWGPDSSNWSPQPTWMAGLTLSWQIFDGGRSKADVRVAKANATSARAQREALLISLTSELDRARAQIVAHRQNVQASEEAVASARAQLRLAEARYQQGVGSQIELADAQTALTTAEGNIVQAEWQLADAWTQLRRAVGTQA